MIFGGLGTVIFLALLDPTVEFILKISTPAKKAVIQTDPLWRRFTNVPCEYAVSFPSQPFEVQDSLTNSPHVLLYRQFASVLGNNQGFMVATLQASYTNDFSKEQIKLIMDETMAGAMEKGDTLIYKRGLIYGTNVGREMEIQKADRRFLKARYYRIGKYLQMLIVIAPPENTDSTNISYFFNSFVSVQK